MKFLEEPIYVTGHRGLVGSAVIRELKRRGASRILKANREELDLRDQQAVENWFQTHQPKYVIHVAGKVGGILANSTYPADFIHDNTLMYTSVLHAAWKTNVTKLLYLGSSCIYPRDCPQPIREEYLLTGPLEPTNAPYAIAKISGVLACQAYRDQFGCSFISAMPTNLYGPGDNFDPLNSHVLPALMQRFHQAKVNGSQEVEIWGTGTPRREFLFVDDLAQACLFLLDKYNDRETINVGTGKDITIAELAQVISEIVYPDCEITFDPQKPDGTPRKLLDVSKIDQLGWKASTSFRDGIAQTYEWYLEHIASKTSS